MYEALIFDEEKSLREAIRKLTDEKNPVPYYLALTQLETKSPQWRLIDSDCILLEGSLTIGHPSIDWVVEFITHLLPDGLTYDKALKLGIFPYKPANLIRWNPSNKEA